MFGKTETNYFVASTMMRFRYITTAAVLSLPAVYTDTLDINNIQPAKVCTICYYDQTLKGDDFCQDMEKLAKQIVYVGHDENLLQECLAFQRDFMQECCEEPKMIKYEADDDHGGRSEPTSEPPRDDDVKESSDGTREMESSYWSQLAMLSVLPVLFF